MRHYFITGATGVVGSAFLQKIAARQERATLLLRADTQAAAEERLKQLISYGDIGPAGARMLQAVPGDLYRPGLGMTEKDFARAADTCTHIVHCAGNVHMNLPLEEARRQTLAMTEGVLALMASSTRVQKMEFVSTVGVSGHTPGEIPEAWIVHDRKFRNSYEAAKAEAEEIVRQKISEGLCITVHRPSMVVGDSRTGKTIGFQVFYHLCEFLSGARTHGFVPRFDGIRLDTIPADYVAAVLDWSSCRQGPPATILHACSGRSGAIALPSLMADVERIFKQFGRSLAPVKQLPLPLFRALLGLARPLIPPRNRRALDALPFFFAYLKEDQYFANTRTVALMETDGIAPPKVPDYLEKVLGYYLTKKKQQHPPSKGAHGGTSVGFSIP